MIPKKIHYCWMGGKELSGLALKCINSRKEKLPDYELQLRDEKNFDINCSRFVKQAYESKKFAFVRDYVRIRSMYNYGGVSMDTDVEVLKNIDKFLEHRGFSGFESKDIIPTGIIGFEKGHPLLKRLLDYYDNNDFLDKEGKPILIANTVLITDIAKKEWGFEGGRDEHIELPDDFHIYPEMYFCPKDDYSKLLKNKNCYTIHYFAGSRLDEKDQKHRKVANTFINLFKKIGIYGYVSYLWRKFILKSN